jgi:Ni,Fe-hydrogenase I large subunit
MRRPRYFQWLQGENVGTVSKLADISEMDGEYFYNFEDGEVCNMRFISPMTSSPGMLKDKFMVEIASPNDPWIMETIETGFFKDAMTQEGVEVPPLEDITGAKGSGQNLDIDGSAVGTSKFRAPRYKGPFPELPSLNDYLVVEEPVVNTPPKPKVEGAVASFKRPTPKVEEPQVPRPTYVSPTVEVSKPATTVHEPNDPVKILAKTCKKRDTDIDLTISIKLPSKAVYDIAADEFENGGDKFIDCLIEGVDVNSIISALRNALVEAYTLADDE